MAASSKLTKTELKKRILSRLLAVACVDLNDAKRIGIDLSAHLERINKLADQTVANQIRMYERRK
jgi:hypothetical protein